MIKFLAILILLACRIYSQEYVFITNRIEASDVCVKFVTTPFNADVNVYTSETLDSTTMDVGTWALTRDIKSATLVIYITDADTICDFKIVKVYLFTGLYCPMNRIEKIKYNSIFHTKKL
jgi:hypothetical protein